MTGFHKPGNYGGNGVNDYWEKVQALSQTFFPGQYQENFSTDHSDAALRDAESILQDVQAAESGNPDILNVNPVNAGDQAAFTHDVDRANAVADANGNAAAAIPADLTYASSEIKAAFTDNDPFEIVEGAFIGSVVVVLDAVQGGRSGVRRVA